MNKIMFNEKYLQLLFDLGIIYLLFISHKISLVITNIIYNGVVLQTNISVVSYEGLLLVSKILTSLVLLATAIYRLVKLLKNDKNGTI